MPRSLCVQPLTNPPPAEAAFRRLARHRHCFFLDSALPMLGLARYSILGCRPFATIESTGRRIIHKDARGERACDGDPFISLRDALAMLRTPTHPELPFIGGAVGYLGYDLCHFVERLPQHAAADLPFPEMHLALHDAAIIYDHQERRAWAVGNAAGGRDPAIAAGALVDLLDEPDVPPLDDKLALQSDDLRCNFSHADYLRALERCIEYIAAGDIFQVNLSRRFETRCTVAPWQLYLRLRRINPAPMAAFLDLGEGRAVVSASPERFLSLRGESVETRPIKGTRPRGANGAADRALADELLASEKDAAELAMIVDLERNDLGRVCAYGSVQVEEARRLESYATVHHMVATVAGRLRPGEDVASLLKATFPGGSITGAPKVRAMEIIDELEPTRRSVYTGAIGWWGFDGAMDLNIAIRTILMAQGRAWLQAGGGIVADSRPQAEYDETAHKAAALLRALGA